MLSVRFSPPRGNLRVGMRRAPKGNIKPRASFSERRFKLRLQRVTKA